MKVWVLVIDHKHGVNARVFATKELCDQAVFDWCKEWWPTEFSGKPLPADDQLVEEYFEGMVNRWGDAESHLIEECVVEGAAS